MPHPRVRSEASCGTASASSQDFEFTVDLQLMHLKKTLVFEHHRLLGAVLDAIATDAPQTADAGCTAVPKSPVQSEAAVPNQACMMRLPLPQPRSPTLTNSEETAPEAQSMGMLKVPKNEACMMRLSLPQPQPRSSTLTCSEDTSSQAQNMGVILGAAKWPKSSDNSIVQARPSPPNVPPRNLSPRSNVASPRQTMTRVPTSGSDLNPPPAKLDPQYVMLDTWAKHDPAIRSTRPAFADVVERKNTIKEHDEEDENYEEVTCPRKFVLSPSSDIFLVWQLLFTLVLSYELILFPMEEFDFDRSGLIAALAVGTCSFWTADLALTFITSYRTPDGKLVTDYHMILLRYAKSWMIPDVLVVLVDWFFLVGSSEGSGVLKAGKSLRYLRVARLLRLLRLRKLKEAVRALDDYVNSLYFTIIKSLVLNITGILVISHFLGCLWFTVGKMDITGYGSWVEVYGFDSQAWEYSYLTCLHWALTQFTPGSMHIQPQNVPERFFAVMMLVMGMLIFSSIVSNITTATRDLKNINERFDNAFALLRRFFKQEDISTDLLTRVSMYCENVAKQRFNAIHKKEVQLLNFLPKPLQMEVIRELYDQFLEIHPLFRAIRHQSIILMQKICNVVQTIVMSQGQPIFSSGERGNSMYFLHRGRLLYTLRRAVKEELLQDWQSFCEPVLWTNWMFQGKMESCEHADLVSVETTDFQRLASQHPIVMVWLKAYCSVFVSAINTRIESGELVDDLVKVDCAFVALPEPSQRFSR